MQGKAWLFAGVGKPFELREFPVPDPEPDGIVVRVSVASICGSDLHGWHGRTPRTGPTIMGHEMTGRVAKLGSRVKTDAAGAPLAEGDRIVYSYFYPCGKCVLKTPDTLTDLHVAPLNCALAQVIYGLHQVGLQAGETVVIQGAGGL